MNDAQRLELDGKLTVLLKRAIVERNEPIGFQVAQKLFATNPEWYAYGGADEEAAVRLMAHEVLDEFLRAFVLADGSEAQGWRSLMVPQGGRTLAPILAANARWLRTFGSQLPDLGLEAVEPGELSRLGFVDQAKRLGRFLAVNDGATDVDFDALYAAVDPRLRSALVNWAAAVYIGSPENLADDATTQRQRAVADALVRLDAEQPDLIGSTIYLNTPVRLCYRDGFDIKGLAETLNGALNRRVIDAEDRTVPDPSEGRFARELVPGGDVVFCPNWTEEHVAYRCMSDAVEALRGPRTRILMPWEANNTKQPAAAWRDATTAFPLHPEQPFRAEVKAISSALRAAETDVLFFPEVTPNNASMLLALQRSARVQAAGYGYPVTTGSPHMDYFVGGLDVEADGREYTEQLLLLPGLGVSTTAPPEPERPRERSFDEPEVRVACIASLQKLNQPMMRAWEAILGDAPHASLDLFPAIKRGQAQTLLPALTASIERANIDLHVLVPRMQLLQTLVEADLYLDTFPYGGFNSLVEVLCVGCPIVTLEGATARERFGAALLRRLELPEFLITHSPGEFVETARRLIADPGLRADVRARIGSRARVLACLQDPDIGAHFAAAVEYMRSAGPRQGRAGAPLLIRAGEAPRPLESPEAFAGAHTAA